jgi:hypothetical protein
MTQSGRKWLDSLSISSVTILASEVELADHRLDVNQSTPGCMPAPAVATKLMGEWKISSAWAAIPLS